MPQLMTQNPWGISDGDAPSNVQIDPAPQGMYGPPALDSGEYTFIATIERNVSSAVANASRLLTSSNMTAIKQAEPSSSGPAWYDIPGRISGAASAVNDAFQSTMLKVIVLVSIVGVIAVFGMSYMQAKGANLAK